MAAPATVFMAVRLGSLLFPDNAADRAVAGALLAMAAIVATVALLGAAHVLTAATLVLVLLAWTTAVALAHRKRRFAFPFRAALSKETLPLALVAAAAISAAILTARWLPVWPWDALAYHLPYVNFVVMGHGFAEVPEDVKYLSTYPHAVELFIIALRLMLPDDRLIDLGQIPFGVLGAIATSGIARLAGARRTHAIAAGCAWLVVPVVFLQLPTDYVDAGSAAFLLAAIYFVLAPPSPRRLVVGGVALGLYLGSKPGAPLGTLLLATVLVARALRAKHVVPALLAIALLVAFGAPAYLNNLLRHGNPFWPVDLRLGPLHCEGIVSVDELLAAGVALGGNVAPRTHGPLPLRLLQSWTALGSVPALDLRIGGYGPLFLLALPFAAVTLFAFALAFASAPTAAPKTGIPRGTRVAAWAAVVATLMAPDPAVARFVLGFPAMVFALAVPHVSRASGRVRRLVLGIAAALGAYQLVYAWPGLLGGGPPLLAYANMSEEERASAVDAVGVDGTSKRFSDVRKLVREGETFAFDRAADFSYLTWAPDLKYRVVWIPDDLSLDGVEDFLQRENVRVLIAGDKTPAGAWTRAHPDRVRRLFSSKWGPSAVYERL